MIMLATIEVRIRRASIQQVSACYVAVCEATMCCFPTMHSGRSRGGNWYGNKILLRDKSLSISILSPLGFEI